MDKIVEILSRTGNEISEKEACSFRKYMDGLLQWNEKVNLTAITDEEEFIVKHYADSIVCNNFPQFAKSSEIIDVGTGGGFPGIPLAILNPDKHFTLLDSLNKRLKIIDELSMEAGINNITTLHMRAEDGGRSKAHREKYDCCISRAVAALPVLSEYCLPFIKIGGFLLAYKGPLSGDEISEGEKAVKILGGTIREVVEVRLPYEELNHNIVVIEKTAKTPAKYPRKAGTPSKEPIK